ncbi:hypothetical protein [Bradyrhizobium sp. USDA 223]|uniref:hypothetical protein n=1 Tax=Bradyrhizobium sp. USDA 223 TaxID=3156306 RepID=UPI00383340FA
MLALGSTFTLFFGGINTVGRRRLSFAYSTQNALGQAGAFSDTIWLAALCTLVAGAVVALIASQTASTPTLVVVALIPIVAAFTNTFDNLRAAYNQHYVTAILQTITQTAIFGYVAFSGLPTSAVIFSALVLNFPYILASALTLLGLCWEKPELRLRSPGNLVPNFRAATYVTLADGAVFSALNASLYALGAFGATDAAAWYGTLMRAFQTLLAPVLLILLPLTSFVTLRWAEWNASSRRKAFNLIAIIALLYGSFVGICFLLGSNLYVEYFFPDVPRVSTFTLACVAMFFGAIIAQKIYIQLVYSVDEARGLSFRIFLAVCFAALLALSSKLSLAPIHVLDVFCLATSIPLIAVIFFDQSARRSSLVSHIESIRCLPDVD